MISKLSLPLFLLTLRATAQSTTPTTTAPLPTLSPDWFFIRAVEEPNYHSYLQSSPTETPGIAVLDANTKAGQFNIISGQLVYQLSGNGSLYMNVENPADKTQRKLTTSFNKTENAYGEFAFQGDTVTWSVEDIDRPNTGAWLVCEKQQLFINTGSYGYETPEGCSDATIHSYGGSTPDV
ncbi:hypothetical protein ASPVEDRAFT_48008 [Aspergillus versicolor CBS 583.65]|uniref:DUF7907 domain-containing protein n=1 Tax=Aspergillus versicolor CBS 583.65 TaxID=1036611 RepID=A0A1L9Q552_ASPVE|nr:uncharacterized protein ASPVEDRAFT_48008 [Aspergillus versicolor CBS 583.65]OJJ08861.1 hypothetical protein ASPVEDRAFT_48008 [Aspergillus versicolor CBS 583.65]